ncbi:hypothetical protein BT96DRAFT_1005275 [Gymnopus androsaceus JB14]|uniref:Uncharacterized protein n=1 Tax=Gymnopus androsaceus JB14 TaxID=1447944 RepID=A0A6A4GND4_9AGAR|nr:hypothetical protein BT96DRAFT_1005275 [Gymnopus androsaceus JB14]
MEEQLNQVCQNLDVFKQKAEKTHASLADKWIPVSDDAPGIISKLKLIVKKCVELIQELLNTVTDVSFAFFDLGLLNKMKLSLAQESLEIKHNEAMVVDG